MARRKRRSAAPLIVGGAVAVGGLGAFLYGLTRKRVIISPAPPIPPPGKWNGAATGFIINGQAVQVPGLRVINYRDDPRIRLKIPEDGGIRHDPVELVVLHTTKGEDPQVVRPGWGPSGDYGYALAHHFATKKDPDGTYHHGGAHILVAPDGTIYQLADLAAEYTHNATNHPVNKKSIGIEIYQGGHREVYENQLKIVVALVGWLANNPHFDIPRVYQWPYTGKPVPRIVAGAVGVKGVIGHRDASSTRGSGDPSNAVFIMLGQVGFRPVNYRLPAVA